jgi:hypothetical protein
MTDCFALDGSKCNILTSRTCVGDKPCAFRKTKEQLGRECAASEARLAGLGLYYDGKDGGLRSALTNIRVYGALLSHTYGNN